MKLKDIDLQPKSDRCTTEKIRILSNVLVFISHFYICMYM